MSFSCVSSVERENKLKVSNETEFKRKKREIEMVKEKKKEKNTLAIKTGLRHALLLSKSGLNFGTF